MIASRLIRFTGRLMALLSALALTSCAHRESSSSTGNSNSPAPNSKVYPALLDRAELTRVYGAAAAWFQERIPFFECPDAELQRTYYFRWQVFRSHIKQTPDGFVITEFTPKVSWGGKYNTISCAAGHHIYEGRWLREPNLLPDYARFWFRHGGDPRRYSFWAADAVYAAYCVQHQRDWVADLLPDLTANFAAWEKSRRDPNGLFWQNDGQDGMEISIGGSGYRATINSYMYGDALALARIADLAGKNDEAARFRAEAAHIKQLTQTRLWDESAGFFKVLPRGDGQALADARELHGYTPWYFNLPDPRYSVAWNQLMDPQGFYAPFGPLTAERRHPRFRYQHKHHCLWNGPSWPYSTAVTLTAMANLLNHYPQDYVTKRDYFELLQSYAHSQRLKLPDGSVVPWIDENIDGETGAWITRNLLAEKGIKDRGKDYNHSSFCDLVITGLVGLRPRADDVIEVNPLVPDGTWDWFSLDHVSYHGRTLTIVWDKTGKKYGRGAGLRIYVNGRLAAKTASLQKLTVRMP